MSSFQSVPLDPVLDGELRREQAHLDRATARVAELRDEAARAVRRGLRPPGVATPQAMFERDVAVLHSAGRRAMFDAAADGLIFGRLDRLDRTVLHVGRIGVRTAEQEPLVVDWRAPAAAAFYQATPVDPRGVVRRRTIATRGERVTGLEDELLEPDAAEVLAGGVVVGDAAFLSALGRERGPHMRDIVATIQREQDTVVRAPDDGAVLVTGGPGTGKTAVALHRVAYLMYARRDRYERRGVLVVGPSEVFVEYISRVLPSLGETSVRLASVGSLVPGVRPAVVDPPAVARVKGDIAMARVARRAVQAAARRAVPDLVVPWGGLTARLQARDLTGLRRSLERPGRVHNAMRGAVRDAAAEAVWQRWAAAAPDAADWTPRDRATARADLLDHLADSADLAAFVDAFWPVLEPAVVFDDLRHGRIPLGPLTRGVLDASEVDALRSAWRDQPGLSVADVAILDELVGLIGEPPEPEPADDDHDGWRDDFDEVAEVTTFADRTGRRRRAVATVEAHRGYAHVVVDEAQDVTPMQWRMLARRARGATWTIVADPAQSAWPDADAIAAAMHDAIGRKPVHRYTLTTNYRSSTEIAALAAGVLRHVDPTAVPPSAVRSTGAEPRVVAADGALVASIAEAVREMLREVRGTVAVIAPDGVVDPGQVVPAGPTAARVSVLDPMAAKGLEFDGCVVVSPGRIVAASATGLRTAYVALTRATQRLVVLTAPDDPPVPGLPLAASAAHASGASSA